MGDPSSDYLWDVFISHASEDKKSVVVPLVDALLRVRLRVWVDYRELVLGDSLRERIDDGLSSSRAGVVVLSESFFSKRWPQRELNGLLSRTIDSDGRVLPVWHGMNAAAVQDRSPLLADLVGVSTDAGIVSVSREVVRAVRKQRGRTPDEQLLQQLIADYDAAGHPSDAIRITEKRRVHRAIRDLAKSIAEIDHLVEGETEGHLLAFVALLQGQPRKGYLLRLAGVCRRTRHRFVWMEACAAMLVHLDRCKVGARERQQAIADMESLRARELYRRSQWIRRVTEETLVLLRHAAK